MDYNQVAVRPDTGHCHPHPRMFDHHFGHPMATSCGPPICEPHHHHQQHHHPLLVRRLVQAPELPCKSACTIMEVAPGGKWNKDAPLELKKKVVADLAAVAAELYRHPFYAMGDIAVSSDGKPCVAELSTGTVADAIKHGIPVGHLSPGPYSTWKEFARNQLEGVRLLSRVFCPLGCLESVEVNLDLLHRWLDSFHPPRERNDRFYLFHPEVATSQIMVDNAYSGRVASILDWDGAQTGIIHHLGEAFCLLHHIHGGDVDEDALYEFYCGQLVQAGAHELVGYVRHQREEDPQLVFEEELRFCGGCHGSALHNTVGKLCSRLQMLGMVIVEEKIPPLMPPSPWRKVYTSDMTASPCSRKVYSGPDAAREFTSPWRNVYSSGFISRSGRVTRYKRSTTTKLMRKAQALVVKAMTRLKRRLQALRSKPSEFNYPHYDMSR